MSGNAVCPQYIVARYNEEQQYSAGIQLFPDSPF